MTKLELVLALFLAGVGAKIGYLGLSIEMISALTTLVTLDIVTGIWAAHSIDRSSVKSAIATSGVLKKIGIMIIPFSLAYFGKASGMDMSVYLNSCLGFISAFELYSIFGNYFSIRKGKRVEEIDALGILWTRLGSIIERFLKLSSVDKLQSDKHFTSSYSKTMSNNENIVEVEATDVVSTEAPEADVVVDLPVEEIATAEVAAE